MSSFSSLLKRYKFQRNNFSLPITALEIFDDYIFVGTGSLFSVYREDNTESIPCIERKQIFNHTTISRIKIIDLFDFTIHLLLVANDYLCNVAVNLDLFATGNIISILGRMRSHSSIVDVELYEKSPSNQIEHTSFYISTIYDESDPNHERKMKMVDYYNSVNKCGYYEQPLSFPDDDLGAVSHEADQLVETNSLIVSEVESTSNYKLLSEYNYNFVYVTMDGCVVCWSCMSNQNKNIIFHSVDTTISSVCLRRKKTKGLQSLSLVIGANDGNVRFFEIEPISQVTERKYVKIPNLTSHKHEGRVFGLASYFVDEQQHCYYASIGEDRSIILWKQCENVLTNFKFYFHLSRLFSVTIVPHFDPIINRFIIVTGSENGLITFWDSDGQLLRSHKIPHCKHVTSLCYNPKKRIFYVSTNSGSLHSLKYNFMFRNPIKVTITLPQVLYVVHIERKNFYAVASVNCYHPASSCCQLIHYEGNNVLSTRNLEGLITKSILMSWTRNLLTIVDYFGNVCLCTMNDEFIVNKVETYNVISKVHVMKSAIISSRDDSNERRLVCLGIYSQLQLIIVELVDSHLLKIVDTVDVQLIGLFPLYIDLFNTGNCDGYVVVGNKSASIDVFHYDSPTIEKLKLVQTINSPYGKNNLRTVSIFYDFNNQPFLFTSSTSSSTTIYEFISPIKSFKLKQQISFPTSFSSIERIVLGAKGNYLMCGFCDQKYFVILDAFNNDAILKVDCGGMYRCWDLNVTNRRMYFTFIKNGINLATVSTLANKSVFYDIEPRRFTKEIRAVAHIFSTSCYHYYVYGGESSNLYICMLNSSTKITHHIWTIKKLGSVILDISVFNVSLEENVLRFLLTVAGGKKMLMTFHIQIPIFDNGLPQTVTDITLFLISTMDPKTFKRKRDTLMYDGVKPCFDNNTCLVCNCFKEHNNRPSKNDLEICGLKLIENDNTEIEKSYIYLRRRLTPANNTGSNENESLFNGSISTSEFSTSSAFKYVYYQVHLPSNMDNGDNSSIPPIRLENLKHTTFYDNSSQKKTDFNEMEKIFSKCNKKSYCDQKFVVDVDFNHRITNVICSYNIQNERLLSIVSFSNGFLRIYESHNYYYKLYDSQFRLNFFDNFQHNCVLCMLSFNAGTDCLLYCSSMSGLFLVFDCLTECGPMHIDADVFPLSPSQSGKPMLVDALTINATSMSLISTLGHPLNKLDDKKYSINEILYETNPHSEELNKLFGTPHKGLISKMVLSDRCIHLSNSTTSEVDKSFKHLCKSMENIQLDSIILSKNYSYSAKCVNVALGLLDGSVSVLQLHIIKIQFKDKSKYYLVDFCYFTSEETHLGGVTDVISLGPNYIVSVAQDKCLKMWHWDFISKCLTCRSTIPLQVNDPCKIVCLGGQLIQSLPHSLYSMLHLKSMREPLNDSYGEKNLGAVIGVFGYGIEFFELCISTY